MGTFGVETAAEESARINEYLAADAETKAQMRESYRRRLAGQFGSSVIIEALDSSTSGKVENITEDPDNYGIIE